MRRSGEEARYGGVVRLAKEDGIKILWGLLMLAAVVAAQGSTDKRVKELEDELAREKARVDRLEDRLDSRAGANLEQDIERYLTQAQVATRPTSSPRFVAVSADLIVSAGGSTASNDVIQELNDGGHDPRRRGFTLNQLEVSFIGNVDPYFRAEAHLLFFLDPNEQETAVELEEAFVQSLQLPGNLQFELGLSFLQFGRHNPQHPHEWQWANRPVVITRMFGPDGARSVGFSVNWLAPTDSFLNLWFGMYNPEGETMVSFRGNEEVGEERPIGGRPFVEQATSSLADFTYLLRLVGSWDLTDATTLVAGLSGLYGPNYTGSDGFTAIYGFDVYLKWRPANAERGWPFLVVQAEVIGRTFSAAAFDDGAGTVFPEQDFDDWGTYAQIIYGFARPWSAGVRVDWAQGDPEAAGDPFRDERLRISLLTQYHTSEFSRIRFQVDYDDAAHLAEGEHFSFWFVFEIGIGAHPAHTY